MAAPLPRTGAHGLGLAGVLLLCISAMYCGASAAASLPLLLPPEAGTTQLDQLVLNETTLAALEAGLWVSEEPVSINGAHVLILDTEGLDAADRSWYDHMQIFGLAASVADGLVYNAYRYMDGAALERLHDLVLNSAGLVLQAKLAAQEGHVSRVLEGQTQPSLFLSIQGVGRQLAQMHFNLSWDARQARSTMHTRQPSESSWQSYVKRSILNLSVHSKAQNSQPRRDRQSCQPPKKPPPPCGCIGKLKPSGPLYSVPTRPQASARSRLDAAVAEFVAMAARANASSTKELKKDLQAHLEQVLRNSLRPTAEQCVAHNDTTAKYLLNNATSVCQGAISQRALELTTGLATAMRQSLAEAFSAFRDCLSAQTSGPRDLSSVGFARRNATCFAPFTSLAAKAEHMCADGDLPEEDFILFQTYVQEHAQSVVGEQQHLLQELLTKASHEILDTHTLAVITEPMTPRKASAVEQQYREAIEQALGASLLADYHDEAIALEVRASVRDIVENRVEAMRELNAALIESKINQPLTVVVQSLSETTEPLQEMTHVFRQLWLRPELVRRLGQHLETVTEDAQEREAFVMEFLRTNPTVQAAQSQAAQVCCA
ncbi:uncharacterized protein MONBRDRAFT_27120 [Monosiga brevicollis MX1]|uniref:Guanylate-binding protein N-terminal domain-containing protein n=1 Tax=Monosiga brevicollis TaxID=81824 RepID=A9V4C8_MONBE|nr:uncharacterized protein MONBRDRAFT_27120 [Monosiga brevicollis MX1]EDQ87593.1 predicted protein [Monosiga brevicollis MX1]|eukprot:XP_001747513.1 hypothetical protein [Monosiga brevicollis MX1]